MAQQAENQPKDEVKSDVPTIAEFFQVKGTSMGGSNIKPLSQLIKQR
jgi:hypothetical protein